MSSETPRSDSRVPGTDRRSGDDLREYVEAFKSSSDRARYALYAVIIATVLVAIATYNFQSWSWPIRRIEAWYGHPVDAQKGQDPSAAKTAAETQMKAIATVFFGGDVERLKTAREEYIKQFTARSVFNASPIPGVSIDYNDLGILGGIALVLLMLILVVCIMREHENLYLALYKVRRLCTIRGEDHTRGDSKANLLYHALAMSQVLSSPPTLARWKSRGILGHFGFIFLFPAISYCWVLWTNRQTSKIGEAYGADMDRILTVQVVLAALLLLLGMTALVYSRAMAKRWERAFFRVNPGRLRVRQTGLWEWLRLVPAETDDRGTRRVVTELVDTLRDTDKLQSVKVENQKEIADRSGPIPHTDLMEMAEDLKKKGQITAQEWCCTNQGAFQRLLNFTADDNVLLETKWVVRGTWTFSYAPNLQPEPGSAASAGSGQEPDQPANRTQ
jgi:hypothetical protein